MQAEFNLTSEMALTTSLSPCQVKHLLRKSSLTSQVSTLTLTALTSDKEHQSHQAGDLVCPALRPLATTLAGLAPPQRQPVTILIIKHNSTKCRETVSVSPTSTPTPQEWHPWSCAVHRLSITASSSIPDTQEAPIHIYSIVILIVAAVE